MRGCGGGSKATTVEVGGGINDTHIGLNGTDNDGTGLAMEAEFGAKMAGSESRAGVAPKDESAGIVAATDNELRRIVEDLRMKASFV